MPPRGYIDRHAYQAISQALSDTRVVVIEGPRQAGKSTLGRRIAQSGPAPALELTLDDEATLTAAENDPTGFVAGLPNRVLIDEIQRAPGLILAIKAAVDRDPTPGRFLLTGSASLRDMKQIRDLLPGRMETIRLWPLSQSEVEGKTGNIVAELFAGQPPMVTNAPVGRASFVDRLAAGGFPEARLRTPERRLPWFRDYIDAILNGDVADLATLMKSSELPGLVRLLAAQTANLLDYRKIARDLAIADKTVKTYVALLEQLFVIRAVRPWRPGIGKREIHAPKLYIVDSGLLGFLVGADDERIHDDDQVTGRALENFCGMELIKHVDRIPDAPGFFHYRDGRDEIDVVIEARNGELVAAEVKASATITPADFRAIGKLRDARSSKFKAGVVFYTGATTIPLGDRIWAVPVSGLWSS